MKKYAVALAVSVIALTGCSGEVSVGGNAVEQADLEQVVSDELEEIVGEAPDSIDCPGDLDAEVGAELRCVLTAGGDRIGVSVTVTTVEGDNVDFDIQVDDEAME
jgi:hypothetical protein